MALAVDQASKNTEKLGEVYDQTKDFVNYLRDRATDDPFTVFDREPLSNTWVIRTGNAGQSFVDALNDAPSRPSNINFQTQTNPGAAPSNFSLTDVKLPTIPNFADAAPDLVFPSAPSVVLPGAPAEPTVNAVVTPDKPTITLPSVPVLSAVSLPDAPSLTIPVFTEVFPDTPDLLVPSSNFEFVEELYQNDLLDAIENLLEGDIANGGFGITSADEESAFSRAVDREVRQAQGREREIEDRYAQRGFRAPTGALTELHNQNVKETQEKISSINREIAINRAELLRRAREFAITNGIGLNQILITDHGFRQERALNAARFAAEFGVTILDAEIRAHNLKVEAFRSFAQAYEVQVRAQLTQTEIFKAQVEAASVEQQINESVVDVYEAQVRAQNTVINLFTAELQAAEIESQIEKLKIEQFEANVQAFVALVQAKTQELELFETQVRAEDIKQSAYASQVQAFATRVDAAKAEADIQLNKRTGDIRAAQLELDAYDAKIRKYTADVEAEIRRVASISEVYGVDVEAFKAILSGWEGLSRVDIAQSEAATRENQEEARIALSELQLRMEEIIKQKELALTATTAGTDAFSAALSSIASAASSLGIETSTGT